MEEFLQVREPLVESESVELRPILRSSFLKEFTPSHFEYCHGIVEFSCCEMCLPIESMNSIMAKYKSVPFCPFLAAAKYERWASIF